MSVQVWQGQRSLGSVARIVADVINRQVFLHVGDEERGGALSSSQGRRRGRGRHSGHWRQGLGARVAIEGGVMFRVRAASFSMGFAVASGIAMFQLQRDVWGSHHILADEVEGYYSQLEKRIEQLERTAGGGTTSQPRPVGAEECD